MLNSVLTSPKTPCLYCINVPLHRHEDFYEFIVITCGSYVHTFEDEKTLYHKNTLLMFQPGSSHAMTLAEPNSAHFTFLVSKRVMMSTLKNYAFDPGSILTAPFSAVSLTYNQTNYLVSLSNAMINISSHDNQHIYQVFLHNIFYIIFTSNTVNTSQNQGNYIDILIERLNNFQYIRDELSSLYMDYPVAQCTLCALFKKRTGSTIVHYRNMKRMEYAAQLLTDWNYSVSDVADRVNISCLSYFSKEFKKYFGITPKEYQKLHRKPYPTITEPDDGEKEINSNDSQ